MEEQKQRLDGYLIDVPDKRIRVSHVHLNQESHPPHADKMRMGTDGKGMIESIELFPGIELSLHRYCASRVVLRHESVPDVMEIHHCRSGRCGMKLANEQSMFLGEGDVFIQTLEDDVDSEMEFPLGYYEGINLQINLRLLDEKPPEILEETGLNKNGIINSICPDGKAVSLSPEHDIGHIFRGFYDKPPHLRLAYYKIKALELLLYLSQRKAAEGEKASGYQTGLTVRVHQIHDYLTKDLTVRPTIEDLAREFHMNTSTLKQVFKGVYGQPVATYMKEFRMRRAMELFTDEKVRIADVASMVGYENQSKFTAAFKQFTGEVPRDYARRVRGE